MAMNWDNVEMIRNKQASNAKRFDEEHMLAQEKIDKLLNTEASKRIMNPRLTEIESMIFRLRTELIDYIVAHGLVDGLIWNGVLQPVEGGKIVITADMVELITENLGYFKESDVETFLAEYLPANDYVQDADYVHTDNNFTNEEKGKLENIEAGAEVNKVIDVLFNNVSVLDDGTRVASITITPEDIKRWYEQNPNTNAFTDVEKTKLAGIEDGADKNRVDDVLVNGRSVLNENKKAIITKEDIKAAYEQNPDTNAFTDTDKANLSALNTWKPQAQEDIEQAQEDINAHGERITKLEDIAQYTLRRRRFNINDFGNLNNIITKDGTYLVKMQMPVAVVDGSLTYTGTFEFYGVVDAEIRTIGGASGTYIKGGLISANWMGSYEQNMLITNMQLTFDYDETYSMSVNCQYLGTIPQTEVSINETGLSWQIVRELTRGGNADSFPVKSFFDFNTSNDMNVSFTVYKDRVNVSLQITDTNWIENGSTTFSFGTGGEYDIKLSTLPDDGILAGNAYSMPYTSDSNTIGMASFRVQTTPNTNNMTLNVSKNNEYREAQANGAMLTFSIPANNSLI